MGLWFQPRKVGMVFYEGCLLLEVQAACVKLVPLECNPDGNSE